MPLSIGSVDHHVEKRLEELIALRTHNSSLPPFWQPGGNGSCPKRQKGGREQTRLAYDDELRRGGHFLGGEALAFARNAVTLRTRNGEVEVIDGPFAETKEMLGGFLQLEARDLQHAIALMSKHPAVKMGSIFEIRPANEVVNRMIAERSAAVAREA